VLLHLHDSIDFRSFHLCWIPHLLTHDLREKQKKYTKRYFHSCMLLNMIVRIIMQPVMSCDFSWIDHHVVRELYREMTWSQSRDLIFRAKESCLRSYGIRAASMLSTESQMISKLTAIILLQICLFYLNKLFSLEEGSRIRNDLWFILTIA
jgi:hypothetical protein